MEARRLPLKVVQCVASINLPERNPGPSLGQVHRVTRVNLDIKLGPEHPPLPIVLHLVHRPGLVPVPRVQRGDQSLIIDNPFDPFDAPPPCPALTALGIRLISQDLIRATQRNRKS